MCVRMCVHLSGLFPQEMVNQFIEYGNVGGLLSRI
uniref:Uncharacterized protein n=1 Tax=Rhizophora mucronata TaxID=61149 RepID=A0A2P2ND66_RHIMU